MDNFSDHELDMTAYAIYKKARKEHIKIDFPTISDDAIEKKISLEWVNLGNKQKMPYLSLARDSMIVNENEMNTIN
jgi:hypothetical protein